MTDPLERRMVPCDDFITSGYEKECDHAGNAPGCEEESCTAECRALRYELAEVWAERNARIARWLADKSLDCARENGAISNEECKAMDDCQTCRLIAAEKARG